MKKYLSLFICLLLSISCAQAQIVPPEGEVASWKGYTGTAAKRAVVLCDTLTVRDQPGANAIDTLRRGDTFMTWEGFDGYVNAVYADGSKQGWVKQEYVVIDPAYYVTEKETPAYAWGDADNALRVGLLSPGEKLPILYVTEDFYVVALRGASAWIKMEAPEMESYDFSVFDGLLNATMLCKNRDGCESAYPLVGSREELAKVLMDSAPLGFASACPFGIYTLSVTCRDGLVRKLDIAADSCSTFILDGVYYEYNQSAPEQDNRVLLDLFSISGY